MGSVVRYERCPVCASLGRDTRGDNLIIYSDGGKHCFSCRFHIHGSDRIFPFPPKKETPTVSAVLPFDFTRDVPPEGWKWLSQYGLPYSYWKDYVGYSPYHERVVFLIGGDEHTTKCAIGRYIGTVVKDAKKWWAWGRIHDHAEIVGNGDIQKLVIVEDLISAHKVGQVAKALPLFGTELHNVHKYVLQSTDLPVVLWLDHDQAIHSYRRANNIAALLGKMPSVVITPQDPKMYDTQTIKELIK